MGALKGIASAAFLAVALVIGGAGRHEAFLSGDSLAGGFASAPVRPADRGIVPVPALAYHAARPAEPASAQRHNSRVAPWVSSPMSGPTGVAPLAHFGVVEEGIVYRSAQPTDADYAWLVSRGFKSVVSLRREAGDVRNHVLSFGFRNYLWLDIEDETDPSDAQAERFLDFVTDSRNWPVVIHCKVGVGRTGTMAALIRYAIDGWPMKEALKEARLYRGGVDLIQSQLDWLDRWAANHSPACHRPDAPSQP